MGLYRSLEEKYYGAMDWLEARGIKVYEWFVNPIESRGIPSFPVAVIILIAVIAGIYLLASSALAAPPTVTMRVSVYSKEQMQPLAGTRVKLLVEGVETPFVEKTNAQGIAEFKGVPAGKRATIRVDEPGFEPFFKEIETRETTFGAELQTAAPAAEKKIVVYVSNPDGENLSGALLVYPDPLTGQIVQKTTDATGSAKLEFSTESDIFKLKVSREGFASKYVTCFASQAECIVTLTPSSELPADNANPGGGGEQETKGSILVIVKNDEGENLAAKVTVFDADNAREIAVGESTVRSPAFFQDIAALGVNVFVLVEPKDSQYFYYNGGQENDLQPVSRETEFRVTLKRRTQLNTGIISLQVVDEKANSIKGATVTLLLSENPTRVLFTSETDADGQTSFEVALGSQVYFTVFASGFLPFLQKSADVGGVYKIVLTKLVPGNNAQAKALVVDDEDKPVELASVQVLTSDGFFAGFPSLESSEDGSALFEGLALDEYRFLASHGSRKGLSDLFVPTITETLEVKVHLSPLLAILNVTAVDVTNNKTIAANISVFMKESENAVASCHSLPGRSCSFKVKANKPFKLKAEAKDYAPSTSEELVLAPEEKRVVTLKMIPLSLSRDLQVIDFRLERVDHPGNVSFVERGMVYRGILTVSFPSNADHNGLFLRVGDKPSVSDEIASITFFEQPADAIISWSTTFNPGADCASDLQNQQGSEAKWVDYEFPGNYFGIHAIAVKIFVKPTATKNNVLKVFYRAYSVKGNTWTRKPFDEALNYNKRTVGVDHCYAKSLEKRYAVVEGGGECTPDACLITWFESQKEKKSNGIVLDLGEKFETRVEARAFKPLSSPYIKVLADSAVVFNEFVFDNASGTAAGESSFKTDISLISENGFASSIGVVDSKTKLPSRYARVFIEFGESGEGENALVAVKKFVVIQGIGELVLVAKPETLYANEKTDLTVWVTRRDDGKPITDARVFIRETSGYPFDGLPNGDYSIQGDGGEGSGGGGKYVFKRLRPTSVGAFEVVAQREGFKDAALEVIVSARNFLDFNPDIASLSLKCDELILEVSTKLDVETPVTASFTDTPCVVLSGPTVVATGNYSWSFNVKPGKPTLVKLEPIRSIPCYLVFNSVLANGAADSQTAWIRVNCKKLEPSPTPSPGVGPGACSSANCSACNERDCIALRDYCTPRYVRLPDGSSVFAECLQKPRAGANATPSPTLAPGECGAGQCWNCDEAQCLALMQNKSCMPQYYYLPTGQRIFLNCTNFAMPDCDPANFNFKAILARRLAQYHSQLLLSPTTQARAIGSTAGVKIVFDQFGLKVSDAGNCAASGERVISCERSINPIVPTNAMAFTIFNQFSFATTFGAKIVGGRNKCFRLVNVDERTPLQKLANLPADISASLGIGVSPRYRTWLIQFLPREGCVEYSYDDEGLSIEPSSDGSSITLFISPVRAEQYSIQLTLNIVSHNTELTKKYAFLFTPFKAEHQKSGVFVNNIQAGQKIKLKDGGLAEESRDGALEIGSQRIGISTIQLGDDEKLHVEAFIGAEAKTTVGVLALDPFANADDPALACSDDKCCAKTDFDSAKQQAVDEVKQLFSEIAPEIETIYNGNIVDGNVWVFNKALDDAIGDYLSKKATYELCKRIGIDPLQKLKERCQQTLAQPLALGEDDQSKGFGEMYGDAFMSAACDSELVNYGMGFSQAVGPEFWQAFKNRLQGVLTPKTGPFYQRTFVVPIDFSVNVVVKRKDDGGQKASIDVLKIRPKDINTPDLMQAPNDWINLEGAKPISLYGLYGVGIDGFGLGKVTSPVTILTGCLAPYFGGNPDTIKVERCKLWKGLAGRNLKIKNYCKDPVEQQEPHEKELPSKFTEVVAESSRKIFELYNFKLYSTFQECLGDANCVGLTNPYERNHFGYGCFDTYYTEFLPNAGGTPIILKFFKDFAEKRERYWLCTQINYLKKGDRCVPLRDVYDERNWLPTMCGKDDQYARCHWDEAADDAYKCCLKAGKYCT